ncbi:uncharacterized protein LOC144271159 [Eretmochelys imbricata]
MATASLKTGDVRRGSTATKLCLQPRRAEKELRGRVGSYACYTGRHQHRETAAARASPDRALLPKISGAPTPRMEHAQGHYSKKQQHSASDAGLMAGENECNGITDILTTAAEK